MSDTTIETTAANQTKATKPKTAKTPAKGKTAATKAKPTRAAKPMREKKPKPLREDRTDWQTFALRMPKVESAALHKAAGPANASRTMRALAAAFVAEDRAAFEAVVEDARKLR